jgi:hypothetical protein
MGQGDGRPAGADTLARRQHRASDGTVVLMRCRIRPPWHDGGCGPCGEDFDRELLAVSNGERDE